MKRYLALLISLIICFSAFSVSPLVLNAETQEPINTVYSDDFANDSLSNNWVYMANGETTDDGNAYTSETENGLLKVNTHKLGRSSIAGCMYLPGKESVNQRVAVETSSLQKGDTISVYARLTKSDSSNWKSLKGYYARYCAANGKVQLFKINTASKNELISEIGYRGYTSGENFRLEIIVTGTETTVITVVMHKLASTGNLVVAKNTYIDTNSPFVSGTAGIGVAGSASTSVSEYSYLDNFVYTSTDNVKDTPKYLSHSRTVTTKTFGQVVSLEKGKEYVFAAYGTVNAKDSNGYRNEPMWVEYQTGTTQTSSTYQRLITARAAIQNTADLTKAQCKQSNLPYSEYNMSYVTFTAGMGDTEGYVDSYIGGKVRHIVGIRLDTSTHLLGNYSYFTLYRKDDPNKTNLLVNPDFKMGFYGWCESQGLYFGYNQCEETSAATTKNGYITILSDKNNYEYYDMFKNPSYLAITGDINKDQYFDVSDLVFADSMTDYYYLADYDKNGSINDLDEIELKKELLNRVALEKPVKKIARIGYRPYDSSTPPEQSLASYRMAYKMGYEILLCDVRTTNDGHFVALHDATINSYARNSEGQSIKNADPINLNDITLAEADTYDFGIYKGQQYAGTKIMRVEEFIALCKELGVTTHLELKETFTNEKLDELVALIKSYGVEDNLMINGQNADNLRYLANKLPNAAMGTWVVGITDTLINQIASYGENNPKFIYVSNGGEATITPENYAKCKEKGIDIAYTEIKTEEALQEFKDLGYFDYCKYIATRYDLY
jgi:glycerophosphoryl diester phosphodiesterase